MKCVFCKSGFGHSLGGIGTEAEGICNTCTDKLFDKIMHNKKIRTNKAY